MAGALLFIKANVEGGIRHIERQEAYDTYRNSQ